MGVREVDPADRQQLNRFIRLERELVGDQPLFYGELDSDARKRLSRQSEFTKEWDLALFANERARGAAIVNPLWQRSHDEPQTGSVGYFAAAPDSFAHAREVLDAAEDWLGRRGVTRVIAPFNGVAFLGMSALTDAFDESPMFPMPWNPPFYELYLVDAGYAHGYPFWYYEVDFAYERYRDFTRRALESPECTVREIDKRRWDEEVETLRLLWNEGFAGEWEFQQFTAGQFKEFFKAGKRITDPRSLLIAEVDGEPAGLVLGMPDLTAAWRSMRGRLGPIKLLRVISAARRPSRRGLLGIAVRPKFRGRRIGATLASALYRNLEAMGLRESSYYPVNDSNVQSRGLAESLGGQGRVLYHCFDKNI
jgi:ribosomal protein S18 acetylase RimI-like enzyme